MNRACKVQLMDMVDGLPEKGLGNGLAGFDTERRFAAADRNQGGQGADRVGDLLAGMVFTARTLGPGHLPVAPGAAGNGDLAAHRAAGAGHSHAGVHRPRQTLGFRRIGGDLHHVKPRSTVANGWFWDLARGWLESRAGLPHPG